MITKEINQMIGKGVSEFVGRVPYGINVFLATCFWCLVEQKLDIIIGKHTTLLHQIYFELQTQQKQYHWIYEVGYECKYSDIKISFNNYEQFNCYNFLSLLNYRDCYALPISYTNAL